MAYKDKAVKDQEIIYYLKKFSSYFNGMFFESLALETFLNLIYKIFPKFEASKNRLYFFRS